jgi:Maltokinase N-terminal cap domain
MMWPVALLYRAELHPTKLELLAGWLPGRHWWRERSSDVVLVGSYRFDDPAGAVGIETMMVVAGDGPIYQVPLSYRDAPLDGGDGWLIGTAEHSVLGRRWVYDACRDDVYAAVLTSVIFAGAGQAEELFEVDGQLERREPAMAVTGAGSHGGDVPAVGSLHRVVDEDPTRIVTDFMELAVVRRVQAGNRPTGTTLTGTWPGQPTPLPLAYASPR